MSSADQWGSLSYLTRRGVLALGAASLLTIDDASARKGKKKRRRKRKKGGKGGLGNTPGPVLPVLRLFPQQLTYGAIRPSRWTQTQLNDAVRTFYDRRKSRYLNRAHQR